jgi:hypothetical protein
VHKKRREIERNRDRDVLEKQKGCIRIREIFIGK